jgi:hypothetical protein
MSYQHFDNATTLTLTDSTSGFTAQKMLSIDRYTFGWEKTFVDGRYSVELRVPVNTQLSNHLEVNNDFDAILDGTTTSLGNVAVAVKDLLWNGECLRFSGGLLIQAPTTGDVTVRDRQTFFSNQVLSIDNLYHIRYESVILSPFVGADVNLTKRLFTTGFLEFDFDATGSHVDILRNLNAMPETLPRIHLYQQDLMRADVGTGYWVYRDPQGGGITGLAPVAELHYTTTLNNAQLSSFDRAPGNPIVVGNIANRLDILNLVLGSTVEVGHRATLAVAGVVPLRGGDDKPFDWELNLELNYRFGPGRDR